jgi:hypothetical protein
MGGAGWRLEEKKYHLKDLGVDSEIILKCTSKTPYNKFMGL